MLELFVYHPNLLCGLTCRRKGTPADAYSYEWGYGWHRAVRSEADARPAGENAPLDSVVVQINEDDGIVEGDNDNNANTWGRALSRPFHVKWIHHWYALGYFLLLFPVPFSRIYLHDHTGSGPGGIGRGRGDIDGLVHVLREDMRRQIDDGVGTERLCKEVGGEIRRRLIRGRTRCGRPRQLGFFFVFYFHETLRKYEWKN